METSKLNLVKRLLLDVIRPIYVKGIREIVNDFITTTEVYYTEVSSYVGLDVESEFYILENGAYISVDEKANLFLQTLNSIVETEPFDGQKIALESEVVYDEMKVLSKDGNDIDYPLYCKEIFDTFITLSNGVDDYKIPKSPALINGIES